MASQCPMCGAYNVTNSSRCEICGSLLNATPERESTSGKAFNSKKQNARDEISTGTESKQNFAHLVESSPAAPPGPEEEKRQEPKETRPESPDGNRASYVPPRDQSSSATDSSSYQPFNAPPPGTYYICPLFSPYSQYMFPPWQSQYPGYYQFPPYLPQHSYPYPWQLPQGSRPRRRMGALKLVSIILFSLIVIGAGITAAFLLTSQRNKSFNLGSETVSGVNIEFKNMRISQKGNKITLSGTYDNNSSRTGDVMVNIQAKVDGNSELLEFNVPVEKQAVKTFTQRITSSGTLKSASLGSLTFQRSYYFDESSTYPWQEQENTKIPSVEESSSPEKSSEGL